MAPLTWGLGAARRSDLRSTLKSVLRLREHAKQEHYSGGDTANMPSRVVSERKRVGSPILSTWRVCVTARPPGRVRLAVVGCCVRCRESIVLAPPSPPFIPPEPA